MSEVPYSENRSVRPFVRRIPELFQRKSCWPKRNRQRREQAEPVVGNPLEFAGIAG